MKNFFIKLLLLSLICTAVVYGLELILPHWDLKPVYATIAFYLIITFIIFYISMLGVGKSNNLFIKAFMTGLTLHLMLSVGGLAVYLVAIKDPKAELNIPFIVSYLLLNIVYTGFEIMNLLTNLRPFSKKDEISEK